MASNSQILSLFLRRPIPHTLRSRLTRRIRTRSPFLSLQSLHHFLQQLNLLIRLFHFTLQQHQIIILNRFDIKFYRIHRFDRFQRENKSILRLIYLRLKIRSDPTPRPRLGSLNKILNMVLQVFQYDNLFIRQIELNRISQIFFALSSKPLQHLKSLNQYFLLIISHLSPHRVLLDCFSL